MKLIAIDLDGTLLNDDGFVTAITAETIRKVREQGHKVVIATGRHPNSALTIAKGLDLTDAVVCFNGAMVMDLAKEQVKVAHSYAQSSMYNLINLAKEWGYGYLTATSHSYHVEKQFSHLIEAVYKRDNQVEEMNNILQVKDPVFKTSIIGDTQKLDQVERFIHPIVPQLLVVRSGEKSIDVIHPQASKGAALQWLSQYYHIKRENIISFGNYDNDMSMLRYAGTGVAMDNAPDHVKKSANVVCHSNTENGVARFLEEHVLNKVTVYM